MSKIKIREASQADFKRICEIDGGTSDNPINLCLVLPHLKDVLVGEKEGRVVGYVKVIVKNSIAQDLSIVVDPDYRRQGIGTALMMNIMDRLRKKGVKEFKVYASPGIVERFYSSLGFKQVNRVPQGLREVTMVKEL